MPIFADWNDIEFNIKMNQEETAVVVEILGVPPLHECFSWLETKFFSLSTRGSRLSRNKIYCHIYNLDPIFYMYTVAIQYNPKTKEIAVYRYPFRLGWKKVASFQLNDKTPDMIGYSFSVSKKDRHSFRDVSISIPIE